MPLAQHRGVISGLLHPVGHRCLRRINVIEHRHSVAVAVLPGQEGCAARRAN